MSIETATRALLTALRTEGTAGAPWSTRVYLHTASSYVELSGEPASITWPCLLLTGPEVTEHGRRRQPTARERISENVVAGTAVVRPWPRFYHVSFGVALQCRAGYTGSLALTAQALTGIDRFQAWLARTGKIDGCNLVELDALSLGGAKRATPADILEAVGSIRIQDVPVYHGESSTVDTALTFVVTTTAGSTLP